MGGEVPKELYIQEDEVDTSNFTSLTVNRGSHEQVLIDVQEPGSVIR